jgi:hypothetical protein
MAMPEATITIGFPEKKSSGNKKAGRGQLWG